MGKALLKNERRPTRAFAMCRRPSARRNTAGWPDHRATPANSGKSTLDLPGWPKSWPVCASSAWDGYGVTRALLEEIALGAETPKGGQLDVTAPSTQLFRKDQG